MNGCANVHHSVGRVLWKDELQLKYASKPKVYQSFTPSITLFVDRHAAHQPLGAPLCASRGVSPRRLLLVRREAGTRRGAGAEHEMARKFRTSEREHCLSRPSGPVVTAHFRESLLGQERGAAGQ